MKTYIDYVKKIRQLIHQEPEVGFAVFKTSELVENELKSFDLFVYPKVGNSLIAFLDLGCEKTIGLRADMDALKIVEETDLPFKSVNGAMHACGHDLHTSILLGVAKYLSENKSINVNVKFIFEEAEEGPNPGGAIGLIKSGFLSDVDSFYALHVWPDLSVGSIGSKEGYFLAKNIYLTFHIHGVGAHVALKNQAINPLEAMSSLIIKLKELDTTKFERLLLGITKVQGGSTYNVIPNNAEVVGNIRLYKEEDFVTLKKEISLIVTGLIKEYGVEIETIYEEGYEAVDNTITETKKVEKIANKIGNFVTMDYLYIAEDFSRFINYKKGALGFLGVKNENKPNYPLHSSKFNPSEDSIVYGLNFFIELIKSF